MCSSCAPSRNHTALPPTANRSSSRIADAGRNHRPAQHPLPTSSHEVTAEVLEIRDPGQLPTRRDAFLGFSASMATLPSNRRNAQPDPLRHLPEIATSNISLASQP